MDVAQLYYTSCEHGLAGYAGYQFNAATPGVDPRVLREVERFTVYEPPRSAPPDRVDEHPVNLCYAPDVGGSAVLSRVVSSGVDPSGRPGNYFAHCLVTTGTAEGDPLPAELWGAGFWAAEPVTEPDLPVLELPPGPLDRERSHAWVRRWPSDLVARLLAAADAAIDDGPPLVLTADSASVAHWVAALTHLLPPARARALSFATYTAHPHDTFVHVVGVPPGADTAPPRGRFTVCDPSADPVDALPEPAPETAALADRLVALGPRNAPGLWRRAGLHASGGETSLAQWHPVVAAAAALDGDGTAGADLPAVRVWLSRAVGWLPPEVAAALVARVVDTEGERLDDTALADLQEVAHRVGSEAVTDRLEHVMLRRSLDGIAAGRPAPRMAPMRSASVRSAAGDHVDALLDGVRGEVPPDRALELLRWARSGGLSPSAAGLEGYGGRVVAARVAGSAAGGEPEAAVRSLLEGYDDLRRGAAVRLAALPRARVAELASGPVGALFAHDRDASSTLLRELRRLGTDRGRDPARLLADVVELRREGRAAGAPGISPSDLDAGLLTRVWGVGHGPREALLTLRTVRTPVEVGADVDEWVTEALVTVPDAGQTGAWRELVGALVDHWLRDGLPPVAERVITEWSAARSSLDVLRETTGIRAAAGLTAVYRRFEGTHPAVRETAHRAVADTLTRWREPSALATALRDCPDAVFAGFLTGVVRALEGRGPDVERAALVFAVARDGRLRQYRPDRAEELVERALSPAAGSWRRRDVAGVRQRLDGTVAEEFDAWHRDRREQRGGRSGGILGRLGLRGGGRRP